MNNIDLNNIEVLEIDDITYEKNINLLEKVPKPPVIDDKNNNNLKKGKISLMIILILILIILLGVGLFLFLKFAKKNVESQIKIEEQIVELGSKIDKDLIKNEKCKVNLDNVDTQKVGKYKYEIVCNNKKYTSYIIVKDTTAPTISLKVLNIQKGQNFEAKDFILTSRDLSEINYKFNDNDNVTNYNYENGLHIVPINAIDEYNNITKDYGILIVSNLLADKYLSASKIFATNYNATLKITDKIGFNTVNYYINAIRIYEYTFNSQDEYQNVKKSALETNSIDDIAGKIITYDNTLSIKLLKEISKEELNVLNGSFPATYNDINELYSTLGYTKKVEMN